MAAGAVRGIQSQNVAACLKHFALNNKETNRKNSDSRVSQRAAREIYLKPFEYVVKNTDLWYMMSSYNIINGCRASECKELLTDILREEWGFGGMVSTDWHVYSEQYKEIKAGNDLRMPGGFPYRLMEAMDRGLIAREEIETSVKRILQVILRLE
jgi:beta-glucosidase